MTAKECFGVVVRAIGLLTVVFGHYYLLSAIGMRLTTAPELIVGPFNMALLLGGGFLVIGLFLLFGARSVVNACYGRDRAE